MLFRYAEVASAPVVLAVKVTIVNDQNIIGAAYSDATTMRKIGVAEFVDNDLYSNLEVTHTPLVPPVPIFFFFFWVLPCKSWGCRAEFI